MLAFWLYKNSNKWLTFSAGMAMFLFSCITLPLPDHTSAIFFGMAFFLILSGLTKIEADGGLNVSKWLCITGDASYPFYLTHIPFQIVLLKIATKMNILQIMGPQITYVSILALSILFGIAAYMLIERPLLSAIKKSPNKKTVALAA